MQRPCSRRARQEAGDRIAPPLLRRRQVLAATAGLLLGRSLPAFANDMRLNGAGSTLVAPLMRRWIQHYAAKNGVTIDYAATGSGTGQSRIMAGDVDFACADSPLSADKLDNAELAQLPLVFTAIAIVHNIPGVADGKLRLSNAVLGALYRGQITRWNDPRIAAENPDLTLPDAAVRPIHQGALRGAVPSGTTHTFQQYMLAANPEWRQRFGGGFGGQWAVGSMVTSGEAMVESVKAMPGAISYMSLGNATQAQLARAQLINQAGNAVMPGTGTLQAALEQLTWSGGAEDTAQLLNLPGARAWPIIAATYVLIQRKPKDPERAAATRGFLRHIASEGGGAAAEFQAAGLPRAAHQLALRLLADSDRRGG